MKRIPAFAGIALFALAGLAKGVTYPGAAPCNTTLQACIDATAAGSTIDIATNGPINESPTIAKSLTLDAATGFAPAFGPFSLFLLGGGTTAATIVIDGLTINGEVRALPGTGDLSVRITNNTITVASSFGLGIEVSSGTFPPYGNVDAEIDNNVVTVTGSSPSDQCGGISLGLIFDSGTTHGVIRNNHVNVTNCGEGTAILAISGPGETMTADIIGNVVNATGTDDGIEVRNQFDAAQPSLIKARVINNVVFGQVNVAGFPGAIVVSADGGQPVQALVLNNTVAFNESGIGVGGRADLGATITGLMANNIAAFNSQQDITVESDFAASFANRNNLFFGPGSSFFTAGPGTKHEDPAFVSPTDLRLQGASPALNAGSNADVPGDIGTDVTGAPRIQAGVVDMGAYEGASAGSSGIPTLSPLILLGLAALLGAAGAMMLRRPA